MRKCQRVRGWGKGRRLGGAGWWWDFLWFGGQRWNVEGSTWRVFCTRHCGRMPDQCSRAASGFVAELCKEEVRVPHQSGPMSWCSEQRCGPWLSWGACSGRRQPQSLQWGGGGRYQGPWLGLPRIVEQQYFHSLLLSFSHRFNSNNPHENMVYIKYRLYSL